jgi:predicted PurR-regulated permease PerM
MCGIFSFIPFVGSALIWVPAAVLLLASGNTGYGIMLLAYGALVITNIDNVFRFILQKKFADVHPIITVLGVIFGVNFFGITGLIFGPLLISIFIILLKLFLEENFSKDTKVLPSRSEIK